MKNMFSFKEIDFSQFKDYSQQQEQEIIVRFFREEPENYTPFFVDVGAYDGITGSNSRMLSEMGWGGILIEPIPKVFARLMDLYKNNPSIHCVQFAVSNYEADEVEMMASEGPPGVKDDDTWHYSQVSTLNQHFVKHFSEQHQYRYTPIKVPVRMLVSILNKYDCPPEPGFICIDCEGEDYRIIQSFDFTVYQPRLLSLESDDTNRKEFADFLETKNYAEYAHTPVNTFFHRVK